MGAGLAPVWGAAAGDIAQDLKLGTLPLALALASWLTETLSLGALAGLEGLLAGLTELLDLLLLTEEVLLELELLVELLDGFELTFISVDSSLLVVKFSVRDRGVGSFTRSLTGCGNYCQDVNHVTRMGRHG